MKNIFARDSGWSYYGKLFVSRIVEKTWDRKAAIHAALSSETAFTNHQRAFFKSQLLDQSPVCEHGRTAQHVLLFLQFTAI